MYLIRRYLDEKYFIWIIHNFWANFTVQEFELPYRKVMRREEYFWISQYVLELKIDLKSHWRNFSLHRCIKVSVDVSVMWVRDWCLLYTYLLLSRDVWLLSDLKEFKSNLLIPVLRCKWTDIWEDAYIYRVRRKEKITIKNQI